MSQKRAFQTTTAAEFRQIAAAAYNAGRLPELIEAIVERIERHQVHLELHESTRDIQRVRATKKQIANLESKLELAKRLANRKAANE